ncbi:hypothetical protein AKJ56_01930 [candidate division MSBL1 archaeon SCGC-AAA382N08]|uniref:Flippase-like domain-containing protein n=1 Tax=candidate division MSBL1 archaeon SCGC-AAA382N08 TaxID=1698285 RepID=A0A133VNR9_9EURY|nr:hypothetical protein AKJ56_01930 [candidate division MSBL1 archaeon SCGC-AAA382N08]
MELKIRSDKMDSKDAWKVGIPLWLGIGIFAIAFRYIGFGEILQNLRGLNLFLYFLAILCIICSIFLWTLRWKFFIEVEGHKTSTYNLFKTLLVGLAINNLTPLAKLGGEPVRAYLLRRNENIRMREGLASVLAELTILFIVTLAFIILSLFLIPFVISPPSWVILMVIPFALAAALILAGIVGIYSGRNIVIRIIEWFGSKIERLEPYKKKLIDRYLEFQRVFRRSLKNRKAFSKALVAAVLSRAFNFAKFYLIFLALGYRIDFLTLFIGMGVSIIVLSLPTTPGSLGVYEGGFISIFAFLGVPPQIAATVVFLERLVWFWGVTIVGGSLGTYYGIDIWKSSKRET